MHKNRLKYLYLNVAAGVCLMALSACGAKTERLGNESVRLEWTLSEDGYALSEVSVKAGSGWVRLGTAHYQRTILYSSGKPSVEPLPTFDGSGNEIVFPEPQYRYIIASWQQHNTPVARNIAGESIVYKPTTVERPSEDEIFFFFEDQTMRIDERWQLCGDYEGDIRVDINLYPQEEGYFSIATPSLISADKNDFRWATVPGVFQGGAINPDFIRAWGYGQGIPDVPVLARERTASTLSPIVALSNGITAAVTAEPGTGRDPWPNDVKGHSVWRLGLSVMNREGELTPTLYHPVLGEEGSYARVGDTLTFSFRYTLRESDWYGVLRHAAMDIYRFGDFLELKENKRSLSDRLYDMHRYLVDDKTSMWRTEDYKGMKIGAQEYMGGVYEYDKDAMKNSDYGAMWMLASLTGDRRLTRDRLPYALNFKLAQQETGGGPFKGAAAGQYYLYKSKRFTEEWGPYTEPVATTYYMLSDMGNILLFEPEHEELRNRLRLAGDRLLEWMNPGGQWEVAYDNPTGEPIFTDLSDLRPTFYGLYIAYKILGDEKYLEGAVRGADWYVENGINEGHLLGVCGDTRFVPDFATVQGVQALLDLYETTGYDRFKEAALRAAKIYTASVYTHPIPTDAVKTVKGIERADWEISQAGLGFEHGGVMGSANHRGPILLASHAGLFVRLYGMTGDRMFLDMARAAAVGRDAFVDPATGVASYYWDSMNAGAGPYPHHAWWQVGWITDYLVSEAAVRSEGKVTFPRGFVTPKVGPHAAYGFGHGEVFGQKARLIMRPGLFTIDNPNIEYLTAMNDTGVFLVLMNNNARKQAVKVTTAIRNLIPGQEVRIGGAWLTDASGSRENIDNADQWEIELEPYGLSAIILNYDRK